MTSSSLTLRPLTRNDFAPWMTLWLGYQHFYHVELSADATQQTFERFLDPAEPMHCTLAEHDGRVIGFVHYIEHRSCWTIGNYCYLQDLYVNESSRGLGAGRQLIEHVYAWAKGAGCARVYWLTQENNTTARKLYDRVADNPGFIQYRKAL